MLELGVGREEVEVDVVSRGRTGILGIGSEPAKVRVSLITTDDHSAGTGLAVVQRLIEELGVEVSASIRNSGTGPDDPAVIDIQGDDAGLIIGRKGDTLKAIQLIVNLIIGRSEEATNRVIVDVEQYRDRRQKQLAILADRTAERVINSGRSVTLEPMSAADRRAIHVALAEEKAVSTESSGEGWARCVTVSPTGEESTRVQSPPRRRRRRSSQPDA